MDTGNVLIRLDSSIEDESSDIHFLKYSDGHEVLDKEEESHADLEESDKSNVYAELFAVKASPSS